jgi:hypothetical protein
MFCTDQDCGLHSDFSWSHLWSHSRRFRGVRSGLPSLGSGATEPNRTCLNHQPQNSKAREVRASEGSNPSATARLIQLRRYRLRTGSLPRAVADERRNNKRRNADASERFPHGLARPYAVTPIAWTYGSGGVRRSRSVRKYTERLIRASVAAAMAPTHQYQPPSVTAATIKPAASTNSVMASPSRHHRGNSDLTL